MTGTNTRASRSAFTAILATTLLSGCLAQNLRPTAAEWSQAERIVVVPMESRPPTVPPDFGPGLPLFGLLAVAANYGEAGRKAAREAEFHQERTGPGWQPNVAIADLLATRFRAAGFAAVRSDMVQPMPGVVDRSYSTTMENWLAPTRAWYQTSSSPAYKESGFGPHTWVAEVALLNYEALADGTLRLRMLLRLVSPRDGRVVGRADAHNLLETGKKSKVADETSFKGIFARESDQLLKRVLADLNMPSCRPAPC